MNEKLVQKLILNYKLHTDYRASIVNLNSTKKEELDAIINLAACIAVSKFVQGDIEPFGYTCIKNAVLKFKISEARFYSKNKLISDLEDSELLDNLDLQKYQRDLEILENKDEFKNLWKNKKLLASLNKRQRLFLFYYLNNIEESKICQKMNLKKTDLAKLKYKSIEKLKKAS